MGKFKKFVFNKNNKNNKNKKSNNNFKNKKNFNNNKKNNNSHNNYNNNHNNNYNKNSKYNNQNNNSNKNSNRIYKKYKPKNSKFIFNGKNEVGNNNSKDFEIKICSGCGKKIIDDTTSFYLENEDRLLCFDCAIKEIKIKYNISPKNKVIYLGSGTFGEIRELKNEKNFIIVRRIQFVKPKHEKFTSTYLMNTKIEKYYEINSDEE